MSRIVTTTLFVAVLAIPGIVDAHDDVVPYSDLTKLLTGGHSDLEETTSVVQLVFGYDFGEDPADPWVIGDPGFNNGSSFTGSFANSGLLPASGNLTLSVYGGSYGSLQYWNGVGSPAFAPVTGGTEIILDSGTPFLRIGGSTTSGSMSIGAIAAGRMHKHANSLIGSGGSGANFDTPGAANGFYAFGATLSVPDSGLLASDPIYMVYNVGMSEALHDQAIDFYNVQVVPEPSSLALAGIGAVGAGLAALRSRQRRSRQKAGKNLA
jgi:hypothetical protein